MARLAQAGHRLGPTERLLDALAQAQADRIARVWVVPPSMAAERRSLSLRAACGVTLISRSSATKSCVWKPLSAPTMTRCALSA